MKLHNDWWILEDEDDDGYSRYSREQGNWQNNLGTRAVYACDNYNVAIDIGACYGAFSRIFAESFEKVISFEVHPDFIPPFWENVKPYTNIELHNIGLWSSREDRKIRRHSYGGQTSVIEYGSTTHDWKVKTKGSGSDAHRGSITAELRTLDSFNFEKIDIIKIDVEMAECHVIYGAMETLARCKPLVVVEVGMDQTETITHFMLTELLNYQLMYKQKCDRIYKWKSDER